LEPKARERLVAIVLFAIACLVFDRLCAGYEIDSAWFAQNNHNQRFLETESYAQALEEYRLVWPPLYPTLLWGWTRPGFSARSLNVVLWCAGMALAAWLSRRHVPKVHYAWPLTLLAVASSHALLVRQLVSETVFVLATLGIFALVLAYWRTHALRHLVGLSLACTAVALTRYTGLLWPPPVAVLVIFLARGLGARRRLAHLALFGLLAAGPALAWGAYVHEKTGYWSGMDRFDRSPEARLGPRVEQVTPAANAILTAKTLYLDFLSARAYGKARRVTYEPNALDYATVGLLVGLLAVWLVASRQRARDRGARPPDEPFRLWLLGSAYTVSLWTCILSFFAVVFVLWAVGNSDPLNSRFLFPIYPFLILFGVDLYAWWKRTATRPWQLLPFRILFLLVLATSLHRHWWLATGH
jgi:hypothetical protein